MKKYETDKGLFFSNWEELAEVFEKTGYPFRNLEQRENVCKLIMAAIKTGKYIGRIDVDKILEDITGTLNQLILEEDGKTH